MEVKHTINTMQTLEGRSDHLLEPWPETDTQIRTCKLRRLPKGSTWTTSSPKCSCDTWCVIHEASGSITTHGLRPFVLEVQLRMPLAIFLQFGSSLFRVFVHGSHHFSCHVNIRLCPGSPRRIRLCLTRKSSYGVLIFRSLICQYLAEGQLYNVFARQLARYS